MTQALSTSYARIPFNSQQILNGLAFNFQRNNNNNNNDRLTAFDPGQPG